MVPKLRFSFKSALLPYKLGTLTQWSSGGTPSKDNKSYWDGDISWFTAASMKSNELSVSPTKISNSGLVNGSRLANKDDILLLVRGSMLFNKIPVGILLNDAAFNQDVKAIKSLKNFNHTFALQWFLAKEPLLLSMVTGTGIGAGKLDTKELQSLDVYLPGDEEQTKIADFLSSVDEKITLLNKKYHLLCQYKKGMVQNIFSQKLRFKNENGKDFPEWKYSVLGNVTHLITNGLVTDQNDQGKGYPVSRIETISERKINLSKVGYVDTSKDISNYRLNYGDMLFSNINSISHIGKIAYFDINEELYHGMNLLRIVIDNNNSSLFFYHQLTAESKKKYFESRANQAVSQASINQSELKRTPVWIPCIDEQIKIANVLSTIDDKIAAKKSELDKLKIWKQGLLQQMFV